MSIQLAAFSGVASESAKHINSTRPSTRFSCRTESVGNQIGSGTSSVSWSSNSSGGLHILNASLYSDTPTVRTPSGHIVSLRSSLPQSGLMAHDIINHYHLCISHTMPNSHDVSCVGLSRWMLHERALLFGCGRHYNYRLGTLSRIYNGFKSDGVCCCQAPPDLTVAPPPEPLSPVDVQFSCGGHHRTLPCWK